MQVTVTLTNNYKNLTLNVTGGSGNYKYSLNGSDYQSSNVFPNIVLGKHSFKVLDTTNNTVMFEDIMLYNLEDVNYNDSFTVSFDFNTNHWTSFHDYLPNYLFRTTNKIWSYKKGKGVYLHNFAGKGEYYNVIYPSFVDFVLKKGKKQFYESIAWRCDAVDEQGNPAFHRTFNTISVRNLYQSTGEHDILGESTFEKVNKDDKTLVNNEYLWTYNNLYSNERNTTDFPTFGQGLVLTKNILDDFSQINENFDFRKHNVNKQNFVSDYVIARLKFNNNDNFTMNVTFVEAITSDSNR